MPYPEIMIAGMRQELARLGIEETKTSDAVKSAVEGTDGTVMVIVNSVCGCAAGGVRPLYRPRPGDVPRPGGAGRPGGDPRRRGSGARHAAPALPRHGRRAASPDADARPRA